jgi:recombination protein RecT
MPTIAKYDEVRQILESRRDKLMSVCADRIDVARQIELAVLCCYGNPKILQCTQSSIAASVLEASDLGLSLSRSSGEAYLIPRRDGDKVLQCHFQAGYQGLIKLARESGQVNYIHARVVCQHDHFEWGWNPELEFAHSIDRSGRRGAVTHVYAVAKLVTGELVGECMTVEEVDLIRLRSQKPNDGPWMDDWEEMAKKTVARRLCKWLPKTPRLIRAIESHDADWDFSSANSIDLVDVAPTPPEAPPAAPAAEVEPPKSKPERITAILAARAAGLHAPSPNLAPRGEVGRRPGEGATPQQPVTPTPPTVPRNARELADLAGRLSTPFFASYGRTRKFPVPMTSWSTDQVRRAWEAYEYERDVVQTEQPAAVAR